MGRAVGDGSGILEVVDRDSIHAPMLLKKAAPSLDMQCPSAGVMGVGKIRRPVFGEGADSQNLLVGG
jgi:hypothetical protein